MKKKFFTTLFTSSVILYYCQAQITVLSNGNVGIGQSNPSSELDIGSWTDILFAPKDPNSYGSPVMYPGTDWYLELGKPNNRIGTLWVTTIHYWDGVYKESDINVKDNRHYID